MDLSGLLVSLTEDVATETLREGQTGMLQARREVTGGHLERLLNLSLHRPSPPGLFIKDEESMLPINRNASQGAICALLSRAAGGAVCSPQGRGKCGKGGVQEWGPGLSLHQLRGPLRSKDTEPSGNSPGPGNKSMPRKRTT